MRFSALFLAAILASSAMTRAEEKHAPVPSEPGATPPSRTARVSNLDEAGWQKVLKSHQGRVLLVNFWATWCDPCREEFPGIVKLYDKYKVRGFEVVTISMDEPESLADVEKFLKGYGASFPAYIHHFEDFSALVDTIDSRWMGGLPATFIYDRQGKRLKSYLGATSYEDFERAILPLLDSSPSAR